MLGTNDGTEVGTKLLSILGSLLAINEGLLLGKALCG
jgi:hypothetical protein